MMSWPAAGLRLEFAPKKFNHDIADKPSRNGNREIGRRKNVCDGPSQAHRSASSGARKLTHEQVGIEQEDYEPNLDHGSPDGFLHYRGV